MLSLGLMPLGCGGADGGKANGSGANAGAASGSGGNAGAASGGAMMAGGSSAAAAGQSSGGTATAAGSAGAGASSGASSTAGSAGVSENVYVDQVYGREGCLPRALPLVEMTDARFEVGQVRCSLSFVTVPAANAVCACDASQNLTPAAAGLAKALVDATRRSGASGIACQALCACNLSQASGALLEQCQREPKAPLAEMPPGFCYVDVNAMPSLFSAAIVGSCPVGSERVLRIMGPIPDEPAPLLFLDCSNALP